MTHLDKKKREKLLGTESKDNKVLVWRSLFVLNELNELQVEFRKI